ncbi:MAG: hypothetical protein J4O12_10055 [Chloroflexi bacterium]|nr:hypothetical protein [Chloroflexota bacterium]MCI0831035.1 hypothetical protein [Chloroflexota bacterium]
MRSGEKLTGLAVWRFYLRTSQRAWRETTKFFREQVLVDALLLLSVAVVALAASGGLDNETLLYGLGGVGVILLIALVVNLIRAPSLLFNEAIGEVGELSDRVGELEDALSPKLEIEYGEESGLRLGNERDRLAYLTVTNLCGGEVRNAFAKVAAIIEHTPAQGDGRPSRQQLQKHRDTFLMWDATEEKYTRSRLGRFSRSHTVVRGTVGTT